MPDHQRQGDTVADHNDPNAVNSIFSDIDISAARNRSGGKAPCARACTLPMCSPSGSGRPG